MKNNKFSPSITFVGVPLGIGAQKFETELGPEVVQSSPYIQELLDKGLADWQMTLGSVTQKKNLDYTQRLEWITKVVTDLANKASQVVDKEHFPIVIGGDHSMAIGTWSGVIDAYEAPQAFGLIWFDAHMDAHTPQTTPSKAIHGMPVAVLLGQGESSLVNIQNEGQKIDPKHLVLIGQRSFETEEVQLLSKLGVKIFTTQEILDQGFEKVAKQALEIVTKGTKGFGVSLDLDGFDPEFAPGTGSHAPNGLNPEVVLPELSKWLNDPRCKAFEIAEFNPSLDENEKTLRLIETMIRQKIK